MAASAMSTPINTITRDNLTVLIRNNIMNDSVEFAVDCNVMESDSPIRKLSLQPISKKLFHSPMPERSPDGAEHAHAQPLAAPERSRRRPVKRRRDLVPGGSEGFKRAYVQESDCDGGSPAACAGMRRRVLVSLFHNKEYSMDFS